MAIKLKNCEFSLTLNSEQTIIKIDNDNNNNAK